MKKQKHLLQSVNEELISADDILGKDVIDDEGEYIGVTDKLFFEKKSLDFIGLSVDKGFLKTGLVIGKSYIREVTEHAVLLNTRPLYRLVGMKVFDKNGKELGHVDDVELADGKNELSAIHVKKNNFSKGTRIPADVIARVENNIILSIEHK